jgi:hypothetical protein
MASRSSSVFQSLSMGGELRMSRRSSLGSLLNWISRPIRDETKWTVPVCAVQPHEAGAVAPVLCVLPNGLQISRA